MEEEQVGQQNDLQVLLPKTCHAVSKLLKTLRPRLAVNEYVLCVCVCVCVCVWGSLAVTSERQCRNILAPLHYRIKSLTDYIGVWVDWMYCIWKAIV